MTETQVPDAAVSDTDVVQPPAAPLAPELERLLALWAEPIASQGAEDLFRTVYADPMTVNGAVLTAAGLVERARSLHAALADAERTILDWSVTPDRWTVAFQLRGRHVGPMATQLGTVAPTGDTVQLRVIDILTVVDGLITGIWMVGDELRFLVSIDAVQFVQR